MTTTTTKKLITEGIFFPEPLPKKTKGTKLKTAFFYSQKNNLNPDGSPNMSPRKSEAGQTWGRFNQCFISSTVACYNQIANEMISEGHTPEISGSPFLSEFDVLLSLSFPNAKEWPEPNRYLWENHRRLVTTCFEKAFPNTLFKFQFKRATSDKIVKADIVRSIRDGFQAWLGIRQDNGIGHIISVIGEENGGFYICDPAGDIRKGYHTEGNVDGRDIFYESSLIDKLITGESHYMIFSKE